VVDLTVIAGHGTVCAAEREAANFAIERPGTRLLGPNDCAVALALEMQNKPPPTLGCGYRMHINVEGWRSVCIRNPHVLGYRRNPRLRHANLFANTEVWRRTVLFLRSKEDVPIGVEQSSGEPIQRGVPVPIVAVADLNRADTPCS
jgi:hypothetical protein